MDLVEMISGFSNDSWGSMSGGLASFSSSGIFVWVGLNSGIVGSGFGIFYKGFEIRLSVRPKSGILPRISGVNLLSACSGMPDRIDGGTKDHDARGRVNHFYSQLAARQNLVFLPRSASGFFRE